MEHSSDNSEGGEKDPRENERTANYGIHDDAVDEHVEEERNLEL